MRSLRVLHVLGSLTRGGVETWLMHVVRDADRDRIQHDFVVHADAPGAFEAEALALGCRVHRCGSPRALGRYVAALWRAMRSEPYDIVHAHVLHFSGVVLSVARAAGIPGRIAHSHSDSRVAEAAAPLMRRWYLDLMTVLVKRSATDIIACSDGAASALLGTNWSAESRVVLLPYGISLAPFARHGGGPELRREHGIPDGVPVFGHVGRMAPEKNHGYLLEVASATLARAPEARFVLIGAGPLKAEIMQRAQRMGIAQSVVFPDPATDHLRWMTEVFSVFIFPSLFEGLPIALIEAQAAGLPCLLPENVVPPTVDVIPSLLSRLTFQAGPEAWAHALLEMGRRPRLPVADATSIVAGTVFNIQQSRQAIERIYDRRQ